MQQLRAHPHNRSQDQQSQSHGQQDFPSHFHQLVKTVTRERATIPDIEIHERGNFHREPVNILHANENCRNKQDQTNQAKHPAEAREANGLNFEIGMLGHARRAVKTDRRQEQKRDSGEQVEDQIPSGTMQQVRERAEPSTQPQGDRDGGNRDHRGIFGQEKQRPAEAAVFRVEAGGQFGLGFGQIERGAVGLRNHSDGENEKRNQAQRKKLEDEPDALLLLSLHDTNHAERARVTRARYTCTVKSKPVQTGHEDRRDDRQAHGHFQENQLHARAQSTNQRIVLIRSPARHHDAEHAQRRNSQHEEDADIHVGDGMRGAERNHHEDRERRQHHDERRDPEHEAVGFGRHDVFFEQQLDGVGNGLQEPVRAHAHGAEAYLHVSENFAFQPVHRDHGNGEAEENEENVDEGPEEISCRAGRLVAREVGFYVIDNGLHQRSTSPRTLSSVPITAITSATMAPRHITSSACRFTKDGGRTRTRYGCVEPSLTMKYPSSPFGASIE